MIEVFLIVLGLLTGAVGLAALFDAELGIALIMLLIATGSFGTFKEVQKVTGLERQVVALSAQVESHEKLVEALGSKHKDLVVKLEAETLRAIEAEKQAESLQETVNELQWQLMTCEDQKDNAGNTVKSIKEILEQ